MTLRVACKIGGEAVYVFPADDIRDPHARLDAAGCTHCHEDGNADPEHHCGMNANLCSREHEGDCWQGPASGARPDGCSVCRPLVIELMPGSATVRAVS
jgi:hypothetical protein